MISLPLGHFLVRLAVAMALGLLVGIERERRRVWRAAGMRTLTLVSMGSALFTMISAYGFVEFSGNDYAKLDPSRIAAQVVTGIGFLGAGAILLRNKGVRGLTTAASVWVIAAIGMACGLGLLLQAIAATVLGLLVLAAFRPIERWLFSDRAHSRVRMRLKPGASGDILEDIYAVCHESGVTLRGLELHRSTRGDLIELRYTAKKRADSMVLLSKLRQMPQVQAVRADLHVNDLTQE
ncbi:MAG: Mg(2+)-transport-ATPase-associated protein MgtC [Ktedonobacterales bacterium]|nr:MAG: Mg(2+)-transport-ATPase-associated protein MgtC [Ktedonobacterales bacterium]